MVNANKAKKIADFTLGITLLVAATGSTIVSPTDVVATKKSLKET